VALPPIEGSAIPLSLPERLTQSVAAPREPISSDALSAAGDEFLQLVVRANERGHSANRMAAAVANGQSDDIHGTMIELSKAGIETRLLTNVKDKIMEAFQELWRMNV